MTRLGAWLGMGMAAALAAAPLVGCVGAPFGSGTGGAGTGGASGTTTTSSSSATSSSSSTTTSSGMTCSGAGMITCGMPPKCVDSTSDPMHCGGCMHPCQPGMTCVSGTCTGCGADLTGDADNCGSCGNACDEGSACLGSQCVTCVGTACSQKHVCIDLNMPGTGKACGTCATVCDPSQGCANGTCQCRAGYSPCNSACADLQNDHANCGMCGMGCPGDKVCALAMCVDASACTEAGATACPDGSCSKLQDDPNHCGGCDKVCATDELCISGKCEPYFQLKTCDAHSCGSAHTCCSKNGINFCVAGKNCPP